MEYNAIVRDFIFFVLITGIFCSSNDLDDMARLKGRIKLLETMLESEIVFKDQDYEEITEILDGIDTFLHERITKSQQSTEIRDAYITQLREKELLSQRKTRGIDGKFKGSKTARYPKVKISKIITKALQTALVSY